MGVSMISPDGFAMRPRMPASWRICCAEPRAPGIGHHEDRVEGRDAPHLAVVVRHFLRAELAEHLVGDAVGHLGPDVDDLVVALAVGDETLVVLVLDLAHRALASSRSWCFPAGITMSLMPIEMPGVGGLLVAEVLQPVGEDDGGLVPGLPVREVDQRPSSFFFITLFTSAKEISCGTIS
jgi:hypothetical protein